MPRKGENIYKRKDGRWEGRYIGCYDENHKAKYVYIYGKTYTEVKQKLAIERGRQKQHVPAEKKQITYGEVLDLWLHISIFPGSVQMKHFVRIFRSSFFALVDKLRTKS